MDLASRRWELILEKVKAFRDVNAYEGEIVIGGSAALCRWQLVDRFPHDIDIQIPGVTKAILQRAFKDSGGFDIFFDKPYLTKHDLTEVAPRTYVVNEIPMIMTKITSSLDYPRPNKHSRDVEKILAKAAKRKKVLDYYRKVSHYFDGETQIKIRDIFYRLEQGEKHGR